MNCAVGSCLYNSVTTFILYCDLVYSSKFVSPVYKHQGMQNYKENIWRRVFHIVPHFSTSVNSDLLFFIFFQQNVFNVVTVATWVFFFYTVLKCEYFKLYEILSSCASVVL